MKEMLIVVILALKFITKLRFLNILTENMIMQLSLPLQAKRQTWPKPALEEK